MRVMERTFREQLFFLVLSLSVLKGDTRYLENNEISKDELYSFFNSELKREVPDELMYRRPLRCLDMVAVEGQFSFTAERPQLSCAAFFMAEPSEVITVDYDNVDIDCGGGDFITVFDGWVMKGEKFPSSQDHPLPLHQRYVDYCDSASLRRSVRSSQNVAMVFFRIHNAGSSFTLIVRKHINPFRKLFVQQQTCESVVTIQAQQGAWVIYCTSRGQFAITMCLDQHLNTWEIMSYACNVISQSPEGSYTMVIPQQQRNCSFSIIYPVEIDISEFSLGHFNHFPKRSRPGCAETGDFVQLLGGNGIDTSKLLPITDLCISFTGPTHMKIGCDNTVVRMVSSGKFVSRVSFNYRLLDSQELQTIKVNNVEDFCFNN